MKEKKLSILNEYYELLLSMEKEARELFKEQLLKAEKKEFTKFNSVFWEEIVFKCSVYKDIKKEMEKAGYKFKEWDRVKVLPSGESLCICKKVRVSNKALDIKENCYTHIWYKYIPTMKKSLFWDYFTSNYSFMKDCSIQIIYDIIENYKKEHGKELKFSL